ncbi:MAG: hypothetical protein EP315_04650 [Gammaproteobacteria bacterium]|nr:MAG: hypothetical protein EP315_04650 [Gammaproteobacteria bacterium]
MAKRFLPLVLMVVMSLPAQARDFEDAYAVYGAGAQPCSTFVAASEQGGREQDFFLDWMIGYLSAFNVIMPETYDILGDNGFPLAQRWLEDHCRKFPRELFVNAMARLTEVLYPTRYQAGLKNPPAPDTATSATPADTKPAPQLKDVKIR